MKAEGLAQRGFYFIKMKRDILKILGERWSHLEFSVSIPDIKLPSDFWEKEIGDDLLPIEKKPHIYTSVSIWMEPNLSVSEQTINSVKDILKEEFGFSVVSYSENMYILNWACYQEIKEEDPLENELNVIMKDVSK